MTAGPASAADAAVEQMVVPMPHTPESVLLSIAMTVDHDELEECRHSLLTQVPGPSWTTEVDLPAALAHYYRRPRLHAIAAVGIQRKRLREAVVDD